MSPVKLKVIVVTTSFQSIFVLLAGNLLLLVGFLYAKSFQMLKISTDTPSL